jgi:uncharacterized protein YndB with AHSA1/START domain
MTWKATREDEPMSDPYELDYGELDLGSARPVLRFTRRLPHAPSKVWRALTEPEHLEGWFPTTIDGERAAGAPLLFTFRDVEMPPMEGTMLAFDPPRLLEFDWGGDVMRFELEPDGDGCLLVVTDTFDELGKAARDGAGWHVCLEQFVYLLDGATPPWDHATRWRVVHPGYVERFGPEASSMGPPEEWEQAHPDDGAGDR